MEHKEILIEEVKLNVPYDEKFVLRWYSLNPPRPWEQLNLNDMFGPQTKVGYIERK